jgi:small subunit ribosomal protein S18
MRENDKDRERGGDRDRERKGPPSEAIFGKKRRPCPFTTAGMDKIDYKDLVTLQQFITERGKILPRRISGVCQRHQRLLAKAIKRSRQMALLSFVSAD